jgi:hypothetical protein
VKASLITLGAAQVTASALVFCAAVGWAAPLGGREAALISKYHSIEAPNLADEGLIFANNGPIVLLREHSRRADNAEWLSFETDACGLPRHVENRHSMIRQSAYSDDMDEFDGDDQADQEWALIAKWLSVHPEIAVISDGVDKTCDDSSFEDEEDDTLQIA